MAHGLGAIWRHRRALASGVTLTTGALVLSTLALLYQGVPTASLSLDDGGVWVTKTDDALVGHLNYPSRLLDGAVRARPGDFDVLQDADKVLVADTANSTLTAIDPATVALESDVKLPADAAAALGGDTVAVLGDGLVYGMPFTSLAGSTFDPDQALADVGTAGAVAVTRDGVKVFAASLRDRTLLSLDATAGKDSQASVALQELADDAELSVTTVGDRGVAFDAKHGVLYLPSGSSVVIPGGAGGRLQQPSADNDAVYLAAPDALYRVPLGGGDPVRTAEVAAGTPSAPVYLNGCAYGVWSGSEAYVRDCPGEGDDISKTIAATPGASLVLRTNRRVVVVNDTLAGTVWLVDQDAQKVDNWQDVVPPAQDDADQEQSQDEKPQYEIPQRSAQNTPPTAVDDEYGVRAGRTTILRVTENDTDPDGDLISASLVGDPPAGYQIDPVLGGAALQIAVPANASGSISFTYRADDGRGGTDDATVKVSIHPPEANGAPTQNRVNTVQVEAGASVTTNALDGWVDPDGDDYYLKQATVDGGDTVTFRSNGVLEYRSATAQAGLKEVKLVVSDGRADAEGTLRVDVRAADSLNPIANADRITAIAGVPITVSPLSNDISPSGDQLSLSKLDFVQGATTTLDTTTGTFTFLAQTPQTYYVQYLVTCGSRTAVGIVRVDVLSGDAGSRPPVAVRDLALLPTGRDVLVDVLANDSDPAGGVLVVQSARVAPNAGVSVEVLEHSILRVTDTSGLTSPVTLSYTVSNGSQSAIGEVLVMPVPLPATLRPPVAVPDTAVVRVGDVVTIPVLKNDYHPDNDTITLLPDLVDTDVADRDSIFVDGENVRFQAGSEPGTVHATYQIQDSQHNRAAAYVTIQVLPADAGNNSAPRPKPVTARVIAGSSVRIAIPLDGIDNDGDSVDLVGVASNPAKGRVTVGDTWLTYDAFPDASGRDTFTYRVRDRLGAEAESTVTVGVATPGFDNQAPYAVKDTVVVKPGRRVAVPVTANDSDPDGDDISIDPNGLVSPSGVDAAVAGGRVVVTAPEQPGEYTFTYTIADTYGATAQGVLLLKVDPNAPALAPIARDDHVSPLSVADGEVDVAVLDNDEDPDGTVDDLTVSTADSTATVHDGILTVAVTAAPQIIRYQVKDADGLTAQAFVFVPGESGLVPVLSSTDPIVVKSGESIDVGLADHVHVRAGRVPRVATADSVRAGHANGASLLKDETTLTYTSAAGYFGSDSLGVQVTDGAGPDDPEGLSAYVSIPITVVPAQNQSPTLRNASVSVAPGEDPVTLNLAKLAYDPDPGDEAKLAYAIEGEVPAGYSASISGSTLTVSASADAVAGAVATLDVSASDGVTQPGRGKITVQTVTSQRPFPVANDDVIAKADQGKAREVDVLSNDYNPFPDRGPLTIVGATVDTGRGTASVSGDKVTVTPDGDFVGTLVVTYRVQDATRSTDRQAQARILLTVEGRPGAPSTPSVVSIQDRTVVLSWTPPTNNGAEITGYTVKSDKGYSKKCASTTCTLDGLTNDVEYTFTVVATNEVGDSDPSPASAVARPDARPDTPAPPTLVFGDKSLAVSWQTPHSSGSPVQSYTLEISPAPATGSIQQTGITGTSLTWSGLENGTAYRVRVRAVNKAPDPSEWSPYSAPMVPAGVPDAPSAPSTSPATPVGSQAQITVSWAAPADSNGDNVSKYELTVKRGGAALKTIETSVTSQNVVVDTNETDYSFSVRAFNKAGWSASSADSAPRRGATAPAAPAAVSLAPGDQSVSVSVTPGALNGSRSSEITYHYRVNQTGATGVLSGTGGTIGGLSNGTSYTVNVWATSTVQGVSPGAETGSNAAVPFGRPIVNITQVNRQDKAVNFVWTVNSNGRAITSTNAPVGGEGTLNWTATGLQPSQSYTLNLSYTNEAGTSTTSATGQANDPPSGSLSWDGSAQGEPSADGGICTATCSWMKVNTQNLPAGTYSFVCYNDVGGDHPWKSGQVTLGAGGGRLPCFFGYVGNSVWVEIVGQFTTARLKR